MAVASASLAALRGIGFGHIGLSWRQHNMNSTHSQHLRILMTHYLPIAVSLLASYETSSNGLEKKLICEDLDAFATLVAENMAINPADPTITSLYSITNPATMAERCISPLAALSVILFEIRGVTGPSTWPRLKRGQRHILPDTWQKNTQNPTPQKDVIQPSRVCLYARELDWE